MTSGAWRRTLIGSGIALATVLVTLMTGPPRHPAFGGPGGVLCGNGTISPEDIAEHFGVDEETVERLKPAANVTYAEFCSMTDAERARVVRRAGEHEALEGRPGTDQPDAAMEWRMLRQRDENGFIPPDALMTAMAQKQVVQANQVMNVEGAAGISSGSWQDLGPGNIGGRIRSILIHPTTPSIMLVGSVGGGIWRTTNSGTTWSRVNDFMGNLSIGTMAMQPSNPSIMYAGTGEGFFNFDAIRGAGIWKSTDAGLTWIRLASTTGSEFWFVNRIAISPDSTTILAATNSGIYRSTDAGTSWTPVYANRVLDVDFHPTSSSDAIGGRDNGQVVVSTDGGLGWTPYPVAATSRVEVTYAKANGSTVYASTESGSAVYQSTNGGANWTLKNNTVGHLGGQGWYDNVIWAGDPTNSDLVLIGGIDLYRSTNGGSSFTKISQWFSAPISAHADHHAIVAHPGYDGATNKTVFFGNDGGIYRADDVSTVATTTGWQELNNTLGITQFYGAGVHPGTGRIVGGTQDNGTLFYNGNSEGWTSPFGGDGGFSAFDPTDSNYCYGEYVYLRIHRSTTGCGTNSSSYIFTSGTAGANFISPFILDPNNPNTLLGGGADLWRSTNVKAVSPSFVSIKPPTGSPISAIAVKPGDSDECLVGHNNGALYKSTDCTAVTPIWTPIDTGTTPLPNRYLTDLAINGNTYYATFGGFGGFTSSWMSDNIWKSVDAGATWTNIAASLPSAPYNTVAINPTNSNWIYVGSDVGLFTSENGGSTWTLPQDGPADVQIDELIWGGASTLYAVTHGRGIWKTSVTTGPPSADITSLWPINPLVPGQTARMWALVKNTGSVPMPAGSRVWFLTNATVSGSNAWVGSAKMRALSPGSSAWYYVDHVVPPGTTPGTKSYWAQVWENGVNQQSTLAGPQEFTVNQGNDAVVDQLWPVPSVVPGGQAKLWALVRNTGTSTLPGGAIVAFWSSITGTDVGTVPINGLGAGRSKWYLLTYNVPSNAPHDTVRNYWAQTRLAGAPSSTWKGPQEFLIGFNDSFNSGVGGWTPVNGSWPLCCGAYIYSSGVASSLASIQHVESTKFIDYTVRAWRYGCENCSNRIMLRGTPLPLSTGHWDSALTFQWTRNGYFSVWKYVSGVDTPVQNWAVSPLINQGDDWNIARVVSYGDFFQFYLNGALVWQGFDSSLPAAGQLGIGLYNSGATAKNVLYVDYAIGVPFDATNYSAGNPVVPAGTVSEAQLQLNAAANAHPQGTADRAPGRSH